MPNESAMRHWPIACRTCVGAGGLTNSHPSDLAAATNDFVNAVRIEIRISEKVGLTTHQGRLEQAHISFLENG